MIRSKKFYLHKDFVATAKKPWFTVIFGIELTIYVKRLCKIFFASTYIHI